jgi:ubiquinone/menaquinone biosynthesis C-methylase UbiE
MHSQTEQVEFFKQESWNYFQRNYRGKNLREIPIRQCLSRLLEVAPLSIEDGSILDIGCGPANNLFHFKRALGARRGVGIEPSSLVIKTLSQAFPELEFYDSDSRTLPFKSGEFDLVLLCGVLAWVDRDYYLQTLGEAIRVCSRYFILNDFAPHHPYSAVYHHEPRYRTYKINFRPLLETTGLMRCVASFYSDEADEWNVMQTALFRKVDLHTAFPVKSSQSFIGKAPE